ncbi:hypothetical protein BH11MYX4_BH11MYX4_32560 [soil metagenome]
MAAPARSRLLALCRSLPGATEDVKWGNDLVFSVGGKMFAAFTNDGKDARFGCKVPAEDFVAITSVEGITPAKYAARFHWISVDDPNVLPDSAAVALLRGSYDLVKAGLSQKQQKQIDAAPAAPRKRAAAASKKPKKKAAAAPKKKRKR